MTVDVATADPSAEDYWTSTMKTRLPMIALASADVTLVLNMLNDELVAMRHSIRPVHIQRYNMTLISRLPFEILAYIFWLLAADEPPVGLDSSPGKARCTRLGWIKVAHVCSHWREVALQNPVLQPLVASHNTREVLLAKASAESSANDYWGDAVRKRFASIAETPADDLCRAFDNDLHFFRLSLSGTATRHNSYIPVSRLPSDLLAHVFLFLSPNEQPRSFRRLPIHQRLGWIKVSQVCRHWREITLATPMLWTRIVFDLGLKWALETLKRSKTAPIIIKHSAITLGSRLNQRLPVPMPVDLVAPHLSHTRVIDLFGSDEDLLPVIQSLILPAPILEHVKLENNSSYGASGVISNLPHDLFAHFAPLLRTASFNGFGIPWSSGFLHNLMKLSVTLPSTASDSSALPPPDEFYGGLSQMTHLAHLSLEHALPLPSHPSHIITLPRLSSLKLRGGPWSRCMAMLANIQFPDDAHLDLMARMDNSNASVDILIAILKRHASGLGGASPLQSLWICDDGYAFRVYGWLGSGARDTGSSYASPVFKFTLQEGGTLSLETLFSIINSIDVRELSSLYLTIHDLRRWDLAAMRAAFLPMHNLKHVHLSRLAPPIFSALLHPTPNFGGTSANHGHPRGMPFPHLQKICLRQDQTRESGQFVSADGPIPVTRDTLPAVLEERRKLNAPVKSINIKQCHISEEWVDELKGNVPTVTWDGKTTPDGYDDDDDDDDD